MVKPVGPALRPAQLRASIEIPHVVPAVQHVTCIADAVFVEINFYQTSFVFLLSFFSFLFGFFSFLFGCNFLFLPGLSSLFCFPPSSPLLFLVFWVSFWLGRVITDQVWFCRCSCSILRSWFLFTLCFLLLFLPTSCVVKRWNGFNGSLRYILPFLLLLHSSHLGPLQPFLLLHWTNWGSYMAFRHLIFFKTKFTAFVFANVSPLSISSTRKGVCQNNSYHIPHPKCHFQNLFVWNCLLDSYPGCTETWNFCWLHLHQNLRKVFNLGLTFVQPSPSHLQLTFIYNYEKDQYWVDRGNVIQLTEVNF